MPSPIGEIKIAGTKYDRRIKLSDAEKEEIRRVALTISSREQLAELYGVNLSTIYRILHPDKYTEIKNANRIRFKEKGYKGDPEEKLYEKRERFKYKKALYKAGKIAIQEREGQNIGNEL